jgi:hypothetical protein
MHVLPTSDSFFGKKYRSNSIGRIKEQIVLNTKFYIYCHENSILKLLMDQYLT